MRTNDYYLLKYKWLLPLLFLCLFSLFGKKTWAVQLSGVYTIDSAQVASATNFKDFQSAVVYMTGANARPDGGPVNTAPFGVSGPVEFRVAGMTWTFSSTLNIDSINGTNPVNTVSFVGDTISSTTLWGAIDNEPLIRLNQCRYVKFQYLSITNASNSNCSGIAIIGSYTTDAGSGCYIKNCNVNLPNVGSNSSYGIILTSAFNANYMDLTLAENIEIEGNTINGGNNGISLMGSFSPSNNHFFRIKNNAINNTYSTGIYAYGIYNALEIVSNIINMSPVGNDNGSGIQISSCVNSIGAFSHFISNNRVTNAGRYGFNISEADGGLLNPTKFYNNMVTGGFRSSNANGVRFAMGYESYSEIFHNTIKLDAANSTGGNIAAFYYSGSPNLLCKNNMFLNTAQSGTGLAAYFNDNLPNSAVNYNAYYNSASANLLVRNGVTYTTNNILTVNAGGDSSFVQISPKDFISQSNLHLANNCGPKGVDLNAIVPNDIDGQVRTSNSDIGCDEAIGVAHANDISILSIISPVSKYVSGPQTIKVRFRNAGNTTLSSCIFKLNVNNSLVASETYVGALTACGIDTFTFSTPYTFNGGSANNLVVYSEAPNSSNDGFLNNDTVKVDVFGQLNAGTYTIDPSGSGSSNFLSFESAINALKAGVAGPVLFNVATGTYTVTAPLSLDSVPGASAVHSITFDGGAGNATSRIITGNVPSNPIVRLNQCSYVSFRNLTITNTTSSTCSGIAVIGNTTNRAGTGCSVANCIVNLPNAGSNTSAAIAVTGNQNGYNSQAQSADSVSIDSNIINGGYLGILLRGNSSNTQNRGYKIRKNSVNAVYNIGINTINIYNALELSSNTINMSITGSIAGYGIYMNNCQNNTGVASHLITGNRTRNAGQYGIFINNANGSASNPTKIYNNMIGGGFRNAGSGANALVVQVGNGFYTEVYHNSMNCDIAYNTSSGIAPVFYYTGSDKLSCKNNIIMYTAKSGKGVPLYLGSFPVSNAVNNNLYYNAASPNIVQKGNILFTIADYKTASVGGDSSFAEINTQNFSSADDLHLASSVCLKGTDLTAFVPIDIDGQARPITPDIGCDEMAGIAGNDVSLISILNPVGVFNGFQDVKVKFRNAGSSVLSAINFKLKVNNVVVSTVSYTGSLPSCAIDSIIFPGFTFNSGTSYNVDVFSESPNGGPDVFGLNDTLKTIIRGALDAGTYTIDSNGSGVTNFSGFSAAMDALKGGILGPVVFNVAPAIYSLSSTLNIPSIAGSSAVNTIIFDGGNADSSRIIGSIAGNPLVRFDNCNYTHFRNLTIENTSTLACVGIAMVGNSANNAGTGCSVKKCTINVSNTGNNFSLGITISGNANGITTYDKRSAADSISIDSNTFNGSTLGTSVFVYANANVLNNRNFTFDQNYIHACQGFQINQINNAVSVSYNNLDLLPGTNGSTRGINISNCNNQNGSMPHTINGNRIKNAGQYGIYLSNADGGSSNPTQVYNNMIIGGFRHTEQGWGIYISSNGYTQVFHNTVNYDGPSQYYSTAFEYSGPSTDLLCKNNIFLNTVKQGIGYAASFNNVLPTSFVNNNIYYNSLSADLILGPMGMTYNKNNFQAIGGDSSLAIFNPFDLESSSDLHLTNGCSMKGTDLNAWVITDIDGQARSVTPDIGCDEVVGGSAQDISMLSIQNPSGQFNGLQNVKVIFKNAGTNLLTTAKFKLVINNILFDSITYGGSLVACGIDSVTFPNQFDFLTGSSYDIKVYASNPNGLQDLHPENDTLKMSVVGALSAGTYTIDSAGSGPNNFISFASAISALQNGITGAVHLNVAAGTYTFPDQIVIPPIPGTSRTNRVTFDGISANNCQIVSDLGNGTGIDLSVVALNQCSYVSFQNFTITNTSNSGIGNFGGITIIGSYANREIARGCSIKKCVVNLPFDGTNPRFGIGVSSEANPLNQNGAALDSIEIDSNIINGGGIVVTGNSNMDCNYDWKLRYNTINISNSVGSNAIEIRAIKKGVEVLGNNISFLNQASFSNNSSGIVLNYCQNDGVASHIISNNKIIGARRNGISLILAHGLLSSPTIVSNNMIAGSFNSSDARGIDVYADEGYMHVLHNSVVCNFPTSQDQGAAFYYIGSNDLVCKNNIFMISASSGFGLPALIGADPGASAINANVYINKASSDLIYRNGSIYDVSNYQTSIAGGDSSYALQPSFVSMTDLHLQNGCSFMGIDVSTIVPVDIDGDNRSSSPHIGCDEAINGSDDIQLIEVLNPIPPFSGSQNVKVKFKNAGLNVLSAANFTLKVNGVVFSTVSYSGSLPSCAIDSVLFPLPFNFTIGDSFNTVVYSAAPNGIADGYPFNDTLQTIFYGSFDGGTYTINPAGSGPTNFISFTAACNTLNKVGIGGPVVFNVSPGIYTEQVSLDNVPGVSAVNTITFNGGDADSTIIQHGQSTYIDVHTFRINTTPYVTLKNLTIRTTAPRYGTALHIKGSSHFAKVKNCRLECSNGLVNLKSRSWYLNAIMMDDKADIFYGQSSMISIHSCEIDSNIIKHGYYGINLTGNGDCKNNKFRNNIIDTTYYAIWMTGIDGLEIIGNRITNWVQTQYEERKYNYGSTGMYIDGGNGFTDANTLEISKNMIYGYSNAGIFLVRCFNILGNKSRICNNMISGLTDAGAFASLTGIVLLNSANIDVFHNTSMADFELINGFALLSQGSTGLDIRNNHFVSVNTSPAFVLQGGTGLTIDFNNYYCEGNGVIAHINGTNYSSAGLKGGGGFNTNSSVANLAGNIVSRNDLHIRDNCFASGDPSAYIASVTGGLDLDNQVRNTPPTIGADEIVTVINDIRVDTIITPIVPFSGSQTISARIKNCGANAVTAATIKYSVNNGVPQTYSFTGVIAACNTATITFATPFSFLAGNSYVVKIWSELPNGLVDNNPSNDTLTLNSCAALNGTYTINPAGGVNSFVSFADAMRQLYCGGISGPVTFNISSGTYNEQVAALDDIQGTSITNTITFQSLANNRDSVILQFEDSNLITFPTYIVKLNASAIGIKSMTIKGINLAGNGALIAIMGGKPISDINVVDCKLVNSSDGYGYGIDHSSITAWNRPLTNLVIKNNEIVNGQRAISISAVNSGLIENNTILNPDELGVYARNVTNLSINMNRISSSSTAYHSGGFGNFVGILCDLYIPNANNKITGNRIQVSSNGGGIRFQSDGMVANNTITTFPVLTPAYYGLFVYGDGFSGSITTNNCFNNSVKGKFGVAASFDAFTYSQIRNNTFTSDSGLALQVDNPATSSDYNHLFSNGGLLVKKTVSNVTTNYANLESWRYGTGNDMHSISYPQRFLNDSTLQPVIADSACWALNGRGIHLPEVTTDIDGNPRPTNIAQGAPDIGAYEFTPASTPPAAIATPASPVAGTTQSFTFGGDTVAKITWAPASSVPSSVTVRQYSGEKPPAIVSSAEHMYVYATVEMPNPGSAPNYTMSLNYRDSWLGTVANPNESSVKLAKKVASNPWFTIGTSSIDTNTNTLSASGNTEVSATFSAANIINPLPVKLLTLTATNLKGDVHVNWATASEVNSSFFIVERSLDGKAFKAIGKMKAQGNSNEVSNYELVDAKAPFSQASTLYYRLKMVDADGSYEYSERVSVSAKQVANAVQTVVYPNPFNDEVFATLSLEEASAVKILVMDITGKVVLSRETELAKGVQTLRLSTVDLHPGMYFLSIDVGGVVHTQKITRY